jgi:hypothetical protein
MPNIYTLNDWSNRCDQAADYLDAIVAIGPEEGAAEQRQAHAARVTGLMAMIPVSDGLQTMLAGDLSEVEAAGAVSPLLRAAANSFYAQVGDGNA